MDSYIVRFYRRERCAPQDIAGVVEHIGSGKRTSFNGQQQLLDRLLEPHSAANWHRPPASIHVAPSTPKSDHHLTSKEMT